ncbi:protein NYNRIN-like [Electrophorus electricus]|uniref:protein NYNRIN-like n=1 Tax=Electrophorus electricus TaxID=8005 RepID=UPI0015CFA4DF|nr:protein NYNRIN-like [Electrophorus electricus]
MLVCVCMFSKWVEAFPTGKQDSDAVAKVLLREIIPWWGLPQRVSSDNGTPFVHEGLKPLTKYLGVDMRKHCSYHPASAGAVERANGTIKGGLAKLMQETGMNWVKCLPLVLWQCRTRPQARTGLSAFEIVFGRPPNTGIGPPDWDTNLINESLLQYCVSLHKSLSHVSKQVKAVLPEVTDNPLHMHQPGDWVLIKDFRRKQWSQPRWRGPFQVLLTTQNRMALDMLLAKERGVCSMIGDHCCTYILPNDAPGDYRSPTSRQMSADESLANELKTFFARFEATSTKKDRKCDCINKPVNLYKEASGKEGQRNPKPWGNYSKGLSDLQSGEGVTQGIKDKS